MPLIVWVQENSSLIQLFEWGDLYGMWAESGSAAGGTRAALRWRGVRCGCGWHMGHFMGSEEKKKRRSPVSGTGHFPFGSSSWAGQGELSPACGHHADMVLDALCAAPAWLAAFLHRPGCQGVMRSTQKCFHLPIHQALLRWCVLAITIVCHEIIWGSLPEVLHSTDCRNIHLLGFPKVKMLVIKPH